MQTSFLDQYSHIHFLGIGGIGISALAKFCLAKDKKISGSDVNISDITEDLARRGVLVYIGPSHAEWVPDECTLVVYSEAVSEDSPERARATEMGIRQMGHFDFLGELSKEYRTICVTGTNGKSTTTAMVGRIFEEAKLDPTVFVGSLVPGWDLGNLRIGESEILIIEGDEYKQKMTKLWPEVTVITNIEEDHLDVYRDLAHIVETFGEIAAKTKRLVIVNADDVNSRRMVEHIPSDFRQVEYFSGNTEAVAKWRLTDRTVRNGTQDITFDETAQGLTRASLSIPGSFNAMNALAAAAVARTFDIDGAVIARALTGFTGIWRRFERVGEVNGATIISDYAHHPTAIKGTLAAAREFFPGRRLVLLFEPHQHSRTKELFDDFAGAFGNADVLVLSEIYRVSGRTEDESVSSQTLLDAIKKSASAPKEAHYAANLDEAETLLKNTLQSGDVAIIMGAGDVDKVARKLIGGTN